MSIITQYLLKCDVPECSSKVRVTWSKLVPSTWRTATIKVPGAWSGQQSDVERHKCPKHQNYKF